tara:strand:+ start:300 stop:458 length:159 start_codon:yes stop_codon:yes gene_type:complete
MYEALKYNCKLSAAVKKLDISFIAISSILGSYKPLAKPVIYHVGGPFYVAVI